METKWKLGGFIAAALLATSAPADTVVLKSGISVDGVVSKVNDNCIAVESGNGRIVYQNDEIESIEKNDKKGTLDLARVNPAALRHEQELEKQTGLNAEQREKVIAVVDKLAAEEANERNLAIKQLIGMQQQFDVYRFLKESRQGFGARVMPGVLEVMLALNKSETKPIILDMLTNQVPGLRAAALQLLGQHKELASTETIARGVADADIDVQIAAINALAQSGDRRATPVLLSALAQNSPRLQNASKTALGRLWSQEDKAVSFDTLEAWNAFWAENSATVAKGIELASLEPLFILPPNTYVLVHE
ncbi:MAG TPA: HEAT repeat domain-containing protein [Candidatus Hydrogenedentes bacterium]|nr:HEAT repeat domain-containing protein [Candidatus Hydrogenedentota bacterium]